jgi:hypothetical protein
MNYSIIFDEKEMQLLKSLIGQVVEEIQIPGVEYSIRFLCGKNVFDFSPEEFSTPEKDNKSASVTRPIITNDCSQVTFDKTKSIAKNFGAIESIQILRTAIIFSPVTPIGSTWIGDVEIPTTSGWNNILVHPDNANLKELGDFPDKTLVNLDIGVLVKTTYFRRLYISTDGCTYWVNGKFGWTLPSRLRGKVKYLSIH